MPKRSTRVLDVGAPPASLRRGGPRALLAMADGAGELLVRHEGREERVSVRRLVRDGGELLVTVHKGRA